MKRARSVEYIVTSNKPDLSVRNQAITQGYIEENEEVTELLDPEEDATIYSCDYCCHFPCTCGEQDDFLYSIMDLTCKLDNLSIDNLQFTYSDPGELPPLPQINE